MVKCRYQRNTHPNTAVYYAINKPNLDGVVIYALQGKKSNLPHYSNFLDTQHTICMATHLKNHYALYIELFYLAI